MEVLERERKKEGHRLVKFLSVFLGFVLLSLLEAAGTREKVSLFQSPSTCFRTASVWSKRKHNWVGEGKSIHRSATLGTKPLDRMSEKNVLSIGQWRNNYIAC